FVLFIVITSCTVVSAHDGDVPPEITVINPINNRTVSGTVDLGVSLDHTHTGVPSTLNITIRGLNVSYDKKIQLSLSNFNNANQRWQSTWDTSDAPNGRYSIRAECADMYGVGFHTINVTVNNLKQTTKVELSDFKAINNQDVSIFAILRDSNNRVLAGKTLQFNIGGKIYSATTDNGGIARITHRGTTGNYNVVARFLGDNVHDNSERTSTLTIAASGSIVRVSSVSVDKGKVAQLRATLTNSANNRSLSGQTVRFTINGVNLGSNTTNSKGVAIYNYRVPLNGGKYTILARSSDGIVNSGTLTVRQSSMFLRITTDNASPLVGNTITLFYRIINDGPHTGQNTVFTYKLPKGFKFLRAVKDAGTHTFNAKTNTITWRLSSAKVGTSLLRVTVQVTNSGRFLLRPKITTDTHDNSLKNSLSKIYLRTNADLTINRVKKTGNTYRITIKNTGGLASQSTHLRIHYKVGKRTFSKTYPVKMINPNKSTTINAKFFKYSTHRNFVKTAHINHNRRIQESNYKNNIIQFK
ncbi:MAG: DUF11 domain-containing protein, partial [Methanobrevibacter sp.]|nr:DUF11 domain-containing protein [Methanobrevibacter sp.]